MSDTFHRINDWSKPASQKIKGLRAVWTLTEYVRVGTHHLDTWRWCTALELRSATTCTPSIIAAMLPAFVRPCPLVPRHGFVDSRLIETAADAQKIARETLDAEPRGEMLITPFIKAAHSAVLTPSSVAFGKGHDGATSGRSKVLYGPALGAEDLNAIKGAASILGEHDVPYVEIVYRPGVSGAFFVQARGGPNVDPVTDFVPREMTVARVLTVDPADDDLLKWEKTIANAAPGTVIYAPGMSLAAHQCVHGVANGVPVVTTRAPSVGDVLVPTGAPERTAKQWHELAAHICDADAAMASEHSPLRVNYQTLASSVAALHVAGFPAPITPQQERWIAYGVVTAAKALAAACLGEARHVTGSAKNSTTQRAERARRAVESARGRNAGDRDSIYEVSQTASIAALKWALLGLVPIYRDIHWSSGYGGKKWGQINAGARRLLLALDKFQRHPGAATWAEVVKSWNVAVHREHNGHAPAFSKWDITKAMMTRAHKWPVGIMAGDDVSQDVRDCILRGLSSSVIADGAARCRHAVPLQAIKGQTKRERERERSHVRRSKRRHDVYVQGHRLRHPHLRRAVDAVARRSSGSCEKITVRCVYDKYTVSAADSGENRTVARARINLCNVLGVSPTVEQRELVGVVVPGFGFHPVSSKQIVA